MFQRVAAAALWGALGAAAAAQTRPSVILSVIVDDLGYFDAGWTHSAGNASLTPNMDALASEGIYLKRHYAHQTCTPSRCAFFSGRLPMHVQSQLTNPEDPQGGIPRNMTVIASKMKEANFSTHVVGKWDIGMTANVSTPEGRGFDSSLIYFEHKNDYWTQHAMQTSCMNYGTIVDLWSNGAPAYGMNGSDYEEFMFRDRVMSIINARQYTPENPLFLVYTPHIVHCPLQVPPEWLARFNLTDDEAQCQSQTPYIFPNGSTNDYRCRSQYSAMLHLLDEIIGNVTGMLKTKGYWDSTLMVLTSDNGGPLILEESGANNAPLRGGKYSDFEGGIRTAAFVSGGFLPPAVRGSTLDQPVHIADWYATFAGLAGVNASDPVAAASHLPPVDGVDMWPLLSGQVPTSPRQEIPVSTQTLIQGDLKYVTGSMGFATWTGTVYPNASSVEAKIEVDLPCGKAGCLFNVTADPTEHIDIAAQHPDITARMSARLQVLSAGFYSNNDTGINTCPPGINMPCACWLAFNKYNGYFGPFQL